ncbi:MAG: chemotaxis-specific protein-glutamate methyltransferase CheB [Actinomycetota bacterium]
MAPIRVLVCDDDVAVRRMIAEMVDRDPDLEVCGIAGDGADVVRKVEALQPDIATLAVEMPVMGGLEILRNLRTVRPSLPVVMVSALTPEGSGAALDALSLGAADCVGSPLEADRLDAELIPRLKALVPGKARPVPGVVFGGGPGSRTDEAFGARTTQIDALLIASSTGGPVALESVFGALRGPLPVPTLVVQHIPPVFSEMLAARLDQVGPTRFVHAEAGMTLEPGTAYLAPGGRHLTVQRDGAEVVLGTNEGPRVNGCRPAADVLFESAESVWGGNLLCAVLTGMGHDGAEGARRLADLGASVIAQDQGSSVVHGMPRAVAATGAVNEMVALDELPSRLETWLTRHGRRPVSSLG